MNLGLENKKALVMGSSSGLGYSIAKRLIEEGAQVSLSSKNMDRLEQAKNKLGASCAIPTDLTQPGKATELVQKSIEALGGLDILVCNAGGPPKGMFSELSLDQWQIGFQSLFLSVVESIQVALGGMKTQKWGRILLVTSVAAKEPMKGLTISNGLRAGLLGLAKSLSQEFAPYGITLNVLMPGYTNTERLKELKIPEDVMTSQIPAARLGDPEELAALAAFLASNQASYITGQAIACDGGWLKGI